MLASGGAAPTATTVEFCSEDVVALFLWGAVCWPIKKGWTPPGEVLWVAHHHAEGHKLLEERRRCYRWEFNTGRIRRQIKLILQICELLVFWCPHECRSEGDFPDCCISAPGEVEEGPVGGSEQGVCSLVLFSPPAGLCLQPRCPMIWDQVPYVGGNQGTCGPAQGRVEAGKVPDQYGVPVLRQHGIGEGVCGIIHEQVVEGVGRGVYQGYSYPVHHFLEIHLEVGRDKIPPEPLPGLDWA